MLENLLKWIAAGDNALTHMGPVMAIAIGMLGGAAITQALKFPLIYALPDPIEKWGIRTFAIAVTWGLLTKLAVLPWWMNLIFAFCQPPAYWAVMGVIRHRWPWLEAGKVLGSVRPSQEAQDALNQRKSGA